MRVALFIRNGLIGNVSLNALVPQMIEAGMEPVLYNTGEPYCKKADNAELREVGFLETALLKNIVEPCLLEIQNPSDKKHQDICYTNEQLAQKYDLDYINVPDVNDPKFIKTIKNDQSIVGSISIRILQIFKEDIINVMQNKGFMWNLHTGLLPKYKGVHIPYWAIDNAEKDYGWTLHNIDTGVDTGSIIATDSLPLDPKKPVLDTYLDMSEKGTAMMIGALMFYKMRGAINAKQQTQDLESYFTFPTNQQMQQWRYKGVNFSDDIVKTYTELYTKSGSIEEKLLRDRLEAAITQNNVAIAA